jgi:Asp-tRNA(Asn)/Glu-tRNA(Gln) amidotransferase A subunit family amidase
MPNRRPSGKIKLGLLITFFIIAVVAVVRLYFYFKHDKNKISVVAVEYAEKLIGLNLEYKERKQMLKDLDSLKRSYEEIRQVPLPNSVPPALQFNPQLSAEKPAAVPKRMTPLPRPMAVLPADWNDLAFYSLTQLAALIRARKITSTELTRLYLDRLKTYGPHLQCVVTLTEELAMQQAGRADREIAAGRYRGPLHGIPWGAKDLLATKGIRTTWGAAPYKDRIFEEDATVVKKLEEAGAVLVAKLSLGELAWGDVWFNGQTRNPWNLEQGSSGSSAGPASAVAAGLVGFALGSETWGSIISPSTRCGTSGLRPTFGQVSRNGAMALAWSMDKIGPICRAAEDCALVFDAIRGPDGLDLTATDHPFDWNPALDLRSIRVGFYEKAFEKEKDSKSKQNDLKVLDILRSLGVNLVPVDMPRLPIEPLSLILSAEAAAAFDDLTRGNADDLLVRQVRDAWPNVFRQARFIPAVEYIQANRIRTLLMRDMAERLKAVDVFVTPSFGGDVLLLTNLTGHPAVVVPDGFDDKGSPTSISFVGNLYQEAKTLRLAKAFQEATDFHLQHPPLEENIRRAAEKAAKKK